jgi:histidine triad (HIT) family protein
MKETLFLKIIAGEIPATVIYENKYIIVIKDINPQAPIHFLIIPKKRFKTISDLPEKDFIYVNEMLKTIQHLSKEIPGADQYKIIINNGEKAGQCIFHLHLHFLAGF